LRIEEFLAFESHRAKHASCFFMAISDSKKTDLLEISRSLWDRESLIADLDIEFGADLASAYCGLGLVMEFLAHQIKATASGSSQVPVEITAIEVGPGER
jgi:hypothetical protein